MFKINKFFIMLVFLVGFNSCKKDENIEPILKNKYNEIIKMPYDIANTEELTIAYSRYKEDMNNEVIAETEKFVLSGKYNNLLYYLYIIKNFNDSKKVTQNILETLIKHEKENSFPLYLASMFYFNLGEFEKGNEFLQKAKDFKAFNSFEPEFRKLYYKVLKEKAKSEWLPESDYYLNVEIDYLMYFKNSRIQDLISNKIIDSLHYKELGKKIEINSEKIIDKYVGCVMQNLVLDVDQSENTELKNKLLIYSGLTKFISNYKFNSLNEYTVYNKDVFNDGEFHSILKLLNKGELKPFPVKSK